ncbi:MAG: DUF4838 domain-containing protein [Clostridia bacterium]|nr:DUF4838 domain-containing protein [Clostridia bacterium]
MYKIFKITSNPTVDYAAEELKKYLRMMMPECGEIVISYTPDAKSGFRLGLMPDFGLATDEAEDVELDDIVHVDTDAEGGILAGSNPRSVLFAVYRFLQENGCRWLFPGVDGEYIPMQDVKPTYYHKMADCRYRGQCNEGAEFQKNMMEAIDFTPKIGLNVFMIEFFNPKGYYNRYYNRDENPAREPEPISPSTALQWKRQCETEISKRGLQFHDMGHGWTAEPFGLTSVPTESGSQYVIPEEMKQYYALTDGQRGLFRGKNRPYDTNICMSNPVARQIANRAIVDYAEKHQNVDYLHVWLADQFNNHCECEECKKKTPSDFYVMMMNELDEMLAEKGLSTRIVFICYVDTSWPPLFEKLKNPKRFSLLVAPISRDYTKAVKQDISDVTYPPYQRNKNVLFTDVNQYVKCGIDWQKMCRVRALLYEYHFYVDQYLDPGVFHFAKVVYDDIINYKHHGLNGLINDCSQRSFWPNGFAFFLYGQLQFDTSLSFEALLEDYFSHAYGEDWRTVVKLLEEIGAAMDVHYLSGKRSADLKVGKRYNPAVAEELKRMPEIAKKYNDFLQTHRVMPMRAQTIAYKLLRYYMEYCEKLSFALLAKCRGEGEIALTRFKELLADFGRHECELETYYDQFMMGFALYHRIFAKMETAVPTVEQQ